MQQGLQERVKNCKIRIGQDSIYLQRVQRQYLEQKLKRAEAWLMQLGKLARLVDYMICQSLVSIIEEEITSFVANILQVRWWWHVWRWAVNQRPDGGKQILTSSSMTSPDPSLQAPRQKPFLSAQLVFDSCGQLSHEPCIEKVSQILTGILQSVKTSALKVFWIG